MRKSSLILFLISSVIIMVSSCNADLVFSESVTLENAIWQADDIIKFEVDIIETETPCSIILDFKHTDLYETNNLWLFIKTISPDNNSMKDTVEFILSDASGKWYGSVWNKKIAQRLLYKKNIGFPTKGKYIFEIEQGMRDENLHYINSVGIEIIKINK